MTTLHPSNFIDISDAYIEMPIALLMRDTMFSMPREATPNPPSNPHCNEDCGNCQKCDGSFSDFIERCKRKSKPITESVILTPIQQRLVNDIVDFDFPILNQYVNELYNEYDDDEDDYLMSLVKKYLRYHKQRFNSITTELKENYTKRLLRQYFKNRITEELIAKAMSPNRIETEMCQFDDIEAYFEAMC